MCDRIRYNWICKTCLRIKNIFFRSLWRVNYLCIIVKNISDHTYVYICVLGLLLCLATASAVPLKSKFNVSFNQF